MPQSDNDIETKFANSCDAPEDYPLNILRTEVFGHTLKSLQTRFKSERLFHPEYRSLYLLDLHNDKTGIT